MPGEAAADAVTGMLLGRPVEPAAGEVRSGHGHAELCLNCGTRLIGTHCHACGQSGHVHRTAGAVGHEIAHGVFHFEGKIWRTLPMLAFRPGELTRRYVAGERARFVSPMAIFLFSVFLLFAVVANLPSWKFDGADVIGSDLGEGVAGARAKLAEERLGATAAIARHERRLQRRRSDGDTAEEIAEVEKDLAQARKAEADIVAAQRYLPPPDKTAGKPLAQGSVDGSTVKGSFEIGGSDKNATAAWLERKYLDAKKNPKLLIYKVKTSAYKYSWALIPISLPFIWLLFPIRRGVGMYDHAIFATYSLSFMSLLVVVLALLGAAGAPSGLTTSAGLIIPPLHIYKQLKGAYSLGRAGALWRTAWMLFFTFITSTLFVLMLLYVGTLD